MYVKEVNNVNNVKFQRKKGEGGDEESQERWR
jgi:hypothetical protein